MATQICLQNKHENELREIGLIDSEDLHEVRKEATGHNLQCLPYLDYVGNTILNQKQLGLLKNDLEYLRCSSKYPKAIDILISAVNMALQYSDLYLLFRGE